MDNFDLKKKLVFAPTLVFKNFYGSPDYKNTKKLENFGGHLLSEDDNSFWAPPYWNIMKETFSLGRTEL